MATQKTVYISLLAAYILFILCATVIGRKTGEIAMKLIPFWSYSNPKLFWEIVLNYILFIPLGALLYLLLGHRSGLKVVLIGFGFSIGIELTQLIFRLGLFEFDDIIGNTTGCFIGAMAAKLTFGMNS